MPIQEFNLSTGQTTDSSFKQVILFMNSEDDLDVARAIIRKQKFRLLGRVDTEKEMLELMRKNKSGMVLIDEEITSKKTSEIVKIIKDVHPDFRVVLINREFTKESIASATEFGVKGLLKKPLDKKAVLKTFVKMT